MFYFLCYAYKPNTASNNRLMGYWNALEKKKIPTTVVFLHPDNKYSKITQQYQYVHFEYYWHRWMVYRKPFAKLTLKRNLNRFLKQLKEGDIVYSYSINKLICAVQKIPGIYTCAEITEHPEASPGWISPMLKLTKEEWKTAVLKLDHLFVISRPLKDFFVKTGRPAESVTIVNMFVDPERFQNIQKEAVPEHYIAYCGTVSVGKDGVDQLIKAFANIAPKYPDLKLYIIGKIPHAKAKEAFSNLISELKIDQHIHFTGLVSAAQIPQLLKNADILALARPDNLQAQYGFPTKLGEYLLTESPVVLTNVGTISDYLKDGESAMIVEPGNAEDFAKKMDYLLSHSEEGRRIGKAGAAVAYQHFNSEHETDKIIQAVGLE